MLFDSDRPLPPIVKAICVCLGIYAVIAALVLPIVLIG